MIGPFCSRDGQLIRVEAATVPVDDINFQYGYGVYETLKLRKGVLYFPELHEKRLFHSAEVIGLAHGLNPGELERWTRELIAANRLRDANIKQLLVGSPSEQSGTFSTLYIMALSPLFPNRTLYRNGASLITVEAERQLPEAKSLNMLLSTIAFRRARSAGAYDALLVDRHGTVTEGTRTNFFVTDGSAIWTAPHGMVLEGVTRMTVMGLIRELGIALVESPVARSELGRFSGCFVTSTSSKIIPVSRIDTHDFAIPDIVRRIMTEYDRLLARYAADRHGEEQAR